MATEVASGYVSIGARITDLERGLASANAKLGAFGQQANSMAARQSKAWAAMGRAAMIGGVGVAVGLGAAVKVAASFESQLNQLRAVSGASGASLEALRKQALKLGASTKFSAREVVGAQTELAKSGLTTAQILGGALPAALGLAAAGNLEVADAAKFTANAMNLFGLEGGKATKVADAFAYAANATSADVHDFGLALAQGGSAARAAGLSFRDTMAVLTALAKSGIKGSDAGTSLKATLLALLTPTKQQATAAKEAGLAFIDASGKMKDMATISAMLRERTARMTQAQRTALFATLAGTDGVRTLLALYQAGPATLNRYSAGLDRTGTAAKTADTMNQGLAAKTEQLMGSLETLGIVVGTALIPPLTQAASALADFIMRLSEDQGVQQFASNVGSAFSMVLRGVAALEPVVTTAADALNLLFNPAVVGAALGFAGAVGVLTIAVRTYAMTMALATKVTNTNPWMLLAVGVATVVGAFMSMRMAADGGGGAVDRSAQAAARAASAFRGLQSALDGLTDANLNLRDANLQVRVAQGALAQVIARIASGDLKGKDAAVAREQAEIALARAQQQRTRAQAQVAKGNDQAIAQSRRIASAVPAQVNALRSQVAALQQQYQVAQRTGASSQNLAKIQGQLAVKNAELGTAMSRLPTRTEAARAKLEALAQQAGPKAAAQIRKLSAELERNSKSASGKGTRQFAQGVSAAAAQAASGKGKVSAFTDSVDTAGFAASLASSMVRDLGSSISALPSEKVVRVRVVESRTGSGGGGGGKASKGEQSVPGKRGFSMEAARGGGGSLNASSGGTLVQRMGELLGSGRMATGLRDAIAAAQEFGITLAGAADQADALAQANARVQATVAKLREAQSNLRAARETGKPGEVKRYEGEVASLTARLNTQGATLRIVGKAAASYRDQLVALAQGAQATMTAAGAAFQAFSQKAMAAVRAPYEDGFRRIGDGVEFVAGKFTQLDRAQDAALSSLDSGLQSSLATIDRFRAELTPAEAALKGLQDQAAAEQLANSLQDARTALGEAFLSRDPKQIQDAQRRLAEAERDTRMAELAKTAEAERLARDAEAERQRVAAEDAAAAQRQAVQDNYAAQRLAMQAELDLAEQAQQNSLDKLEQQLGTLPAILARTKVKATPELRKLQALLGQFGENAGSSFVSELVSALDGLDTGIARQLARRVRPYLELHSPADKGPLSTIDQWWQPLVPTLMEGVDGNVGQAISGMGPATFSTGTAPRPVEVHIHMEGATTLGTSSETAREIARQLKPELDRLVSVRV